MARAVVLAIPGLPPRLPDHHVRLRGATVLRAVPCSRSGGPVALLAHAGSFMLFALIVRKLPAMPQSVPEVREGLFRQAWDDASHVFRDRLLLGLALRPAIGNVAGLLLTSNGLPSCMWPAVAAARTSNRRVDAALRAAAPAGGPDRTGGKEPSPGACTRLARRSSVPAVDSRRARRRPAPERDVAEGHVGVRGVGGRHHFRAHAAVEVQHTLPSRSSGFGPRGGLEALALAAYVPDGHESDEFLHGLPRNGSAGGCSRGSQRLTRLRYTRLRCGMVWYQTMRCSSSYVRRRIGWGSS